MDCALKISLIAGSTYRVNQQPSPQGKVQRLGFNP